MTIRKTKHTLTYADKRNGFSPSPWTLEVLSDLKRGIKHPELKIVRGGCWEINGVPRVKRRSGRVAA